MGSCGVPTCSCSAVITGAPLAMTGRDWYRLLRKSCGDSPTKAKVLCVRVN